MHPIDFIFSHATSILLNEIDYRKSSLGEKCSVCLRSSSQWIEPEIAVDFKGYYSEVHCIACHTLFHPSEIMNRKGKGVGKRRC